MALGSQFFEEKVRDTRCSYGPKYKLQVLTNPIYRMYDPIEITSYIYIYITNKWGDPSQSI